jgi:AcrR family transcriptional regulator
MEKERSYDRKRREICLAALDLFFARGFEGTTLEAVAEVLGYTKPALYYYFDSKEALFRSIMLTALREAAARIEEIRTEDRTPRSKLRDIIRMYLDDGFTHRGYFSISHLIRGQRESLLEGPGGEEILALSRAVPQTITDIIAEGIAAGEFVPEDPQVLGSIVFAMLSGVLMHMTMPALAGAEQSHIRSSLDEIIVKGISA